MSGSEWAAVLAAQVCLVLLVVLVVMIVRLDRAGQGPPPAPRSTSAPRPSPRSHELRAVVRAADFELDRVDAIVSGAERVGDRVDAASDLAYRTFTNPVVKALAVGTGTRRAVQRLKGDKPAKPARRDGRKAS